MLKKILLFSPILYFVILPFVFWPKFVDPYELPKVILFISSSYILIGLYIWEILSQNYPNVKLSKTHFLILILIVLLTISSLINGIIANSFWGQYFRYEGIITLISYLLFTIFFSNLEKIGLTRENIGKAISLGGMLVAILILFQAVAFYCFRLPIYTYNGRLTALLGNPNFAAGFLALSFPFVIFYPIKKINFLFAFCTLSSALILTGSRSGLLAFLIVTTLFVFEKFPKKILLLFFISLTSFISIIFLIFFSRPTSPTENRPVIWGKALEASLRKPLFGWGVENFSTAFQSVLGPKDFDLKKIRVDKAHNELLDMLVAGGIVGLGLYLFILVRTIKILWKNKEDIWAKTNLLCLLAFLIVSQLNVLNITEYLFFYLILSQTSTFEKFKQI